MLNNICFNIFSYPKPKANIFNFAFPLSASSIVAKWCTDRRIASQDKNKKLNLLQIQNERTNLKLFYPFGCKVGMMLVLLFFRRPLPNFPPSFSVSSFAFSRLTSLLSKTALTSHIHVFLYFPLSFCFFGLASYTFFVNFSSCIIILTLVEQLFCRLVYLYLLAFSSWPILYFYTVKTSTGYSFSFLYLL